MPHLARRDELHKSQLLQSLHLQRSRVCSRTGHADLKELFSILPLLQRSQRDTTAVVIRQVIVVVQVRREACVDVGDGVGEDGEGEAEIAGRNADLGVRSEVG